MAAVDDGSEFAITIANRENPDKPIELAVDAETGY
jgi:hypothetical protein